MLVKYKDVEESRIMRSIYIHNFEGDNPEETYNNIENGINIELKVNGKEVNFLEHVSQYDEILNKCVNNLEEEIREKAEQLLKEKFSDICEKQEYITKKIEELDWYIENEFEVRV